jgi:hypothetical protein
MESTGIPKLMQYYKPRAFGRPGGTIRRILYGDKTDLITGLIRD